MPLTQKNFNPDLILTHKSKGKDTNSQYIIILFIFVCRDIKVTFFLISGDAMNNFLNAHWEEAFETYKYLPEEAFGVLFRDLSNRVFKLFPYKELFLD